MVGLILDAAHTAATLGRTLDRVLLPRWAWAALIPEVDPSCRWPYEGRKYSGVMYVDLHTVSGSVRIEPYDGDGIAFHVKEG